MMPSKKRNFHMSLVADHTKKPTVFTCDYCGAQGKYKVLVKTQCNYAYPPCKFCKGTADTNECAPDCAGIAAILSDPDVYVAGCL